jgi:hypothetical protein
MALRRRGPRSAFQTGAVSTAVTPGNRRTCVVFSLLGVVGIALILFVVVAATAGVVFGK